jgi:UDP-glucose 4-epimerase
VRDYLYIDDMVAACCQLIARGCDSETFNVGAGIGTSINRLHQVIEQIVEGSIPVQRLPARSLDVRAIMLNSSKLMRATGWAPAVNLEEGIARTWQWLNQS